MKRAIVLVLLFFVLTESKAQSVNVDTLVAQVMKLLISAKYQEGLDLSKQARRYWDESEEKDTAQLVRVLSAEGLSTYFLGNFQEAETLYLTAEKYQREKFGTENAQYINIIGKLIAVYVSQKLYDKAKPLVSRSLDLNSRLNNQNSVGYAVLLQNKAMIYDSESKYDSSIYTLNEAKDILLKVTGTKNRYYAQIVQALGEPYMMLEQYKESESCYLEAARIYEELYSKEYPQTLNMYYNLARVKIISGEYQEAERILLELDSSYLAVFGELSPSYAEYLNLMGLLYISLSNFDKAEKFARRTKEIRIAFYGENSLYHVQSLANLLSIHTYRREYMDAKLLAEKAIAIYDSLRANDVEIHMTLKLNLGIINHQLGLFTEAEANLKDALALAKSAFGPHHEKYANVLNGLGLLYNSLGMYKDAVKVLEECKAVREKTIGPMDLAYTLTLHYLAHSYYSVGDTQYISTYQLASKLDQIIIKKAMLFQSQHELMTSVAVVNTKINKRRSNLYKSDYPLNELEYDTELSTKGFLLQNYQYLKAKSKEDRVMDSLFSKIVENDELLAIEYATVSSVRNDDKIDLLIDENEAYEKKIHLVAGHTNNTIGEVKWRDVQNALKQNEAAVEFVRIPFVKDETAATDSVIYKALIVRKDMEGVYSITLCRESDLQLASAEESKRRQEFIQEQYTYDPNNRKSNFQLIWQPILEKLEGIDFVYFSPVGALNRINLSAISIDDETVVGDLIDLVLIGSTRQIVTDTTKNLYDGEICLYGNIQYEPDTSVVVNSDTSQIQNEISESGISNDPFMDDAFRGGDWTQLKGSFQELSDIKAIAEQEGIIYKSYENVDASEESFKELGISGARTSSPRVIHLSTHGYFFPDPKETSFTSITGQEPIFKLSDHPMIRSGLILAGGNYAWKHGHPYMPGMEDGILTAYEISQMDLSDTELVVLSACETGLGDIEGNEGVYGLQRAFKIAGVKNLIMSLWQVPDKATAELMTMFYENWLIKEMTIREALHTAQKTMRDKGYEHFYWAGFVLVE